MRKKRSHFIAFIAIRVLQIPRNDNAARWILSGVHEMTLGLIWKVQSLKRLILLSVGLNFILIVTNTRYEHRK